MKNYINSKFKIFLLQNKKDYAYLPQNNNIIKIFKKNNLEANIILNKGRIQKFIKKNISNTHLMSQSNLSKHIFYL